MALKIANPTPPNPPPFPLAHSAIESSSSSAIDEPHKMAPGCELGVLLIAYSTFQYAQATATTTARKTA